ncbi:SDR family NAD(P)-dependent oxidoreductase [Actinomadura sp. SCN-SB]|uniref:SDR family NAD(P)-dependent oxidoreductase n=1 Tax=Actinomadura sp. SCN-SB TaxID=3373092 RepID=UPI003752BA0E
MTTILITGATGGLGRHLARRLAERGDTVLAHGRDQARLDRLAKELNGADLTTYTADLSSLAEARDLAARVSAAHDRLDVLVNNAGVGFGAPGSGREPGTDGHELRWTVNYLAPVLLTRSLLPALRAAAPSRIVNVGSLGQEGIDFDDVELVRGYDGVTAYRRSKLALAAWTFDLAEELRPDRIAVNCLHPATFMDTAMVTDAGVTPRSTVEEGGDAVMKLIDAPHEVTGRFFDGTHESRAHPDAYDPEVRHRLQKATTQALEQA